MTDETQASPIDNPWAWWRDALAGKIGPIYDGHPQCGFYRKRKYRGGPWQPVALWRDAETGDVIGMLDGEDLDEQAAAEIWTWVCNNPTSEETYRAVAEEGQPWPDEVRGLGDNKPPEDEDFGSLKEDIDRVVELARDAIKSGIKDKATADQAANIRDRLNELKKQADDKRKEENKPHYEAGKKVQAKWKPLIDAATDGAASLRAPIGKVLAELQRQENIKAAQNEGPEAPTTARIGGAHGRRTGLTTRTTIEITDYAKALEALKDEPDVRDTVERIAARRARAGVETPGVKIIKEKVAT